VIAGVAILLATAAIVVAALAHSRLDEHDERLDAMARDAGRDSGLDELPPEVEPPRAPIGFRRE
jgi:hypothetical protein